MDKMREEMGGAHGAQPQWEVQGQVGKGAHGVVYKVCVGGGWEGQSMGGGEVHALTGLSISSGIPACLLCVLFFSERAPHTAVLTRGSTGTFACQSIRFKFQPILCFVRAQGTWRGLQVAIKRSLFQVLGDPQAEANRKVRTSGSENIIPLGPGGCGSCDFTATVVLGRSPIVPRKWDPDCGWALC